LANVQHSNLTDPNLHEPKGVSTATADQVYISNGSGSGNWRNVNRIPGTGWGQYSNSVYTGSTYLTINATGVIVPFDTNTDVTQLPITLSGSTSPLMDLATERLLFVSAGDMHSITLSYFINSTTGSPTFMDITLYTSTDGVTYGTLLAETTVAILKSGTQYVNVSSLFPVTSNMVSYGVKIQMKMDTGDTADIKNINLITTRVHKAR
jgi:hypothetical protein